MNLDHAIYLLTGYPNYPIATLIVLALGIFSITRLINTDSFPPIERARTWLFEHFPHEGYTTRNVPNQKRAEFISTGDHFYVTVGHWLGELVHCPWCAGWWVSLAASLSFWAWPVSTLAVMVPFAFRALVGIISNKLS